MRTIGIALAVAATGSVVLGCGPTAERRSSGAAGRAEVVSVIDGDTVELTIGGTRERVRLLGIDAPESVAVNVPEQCFGAEASAALAELLPPGTAVEITRDAESRDRYGRLLLYLVRSSDGLFVNEWLVASGYAAAVSYEPNTAHRPALAGAERRATAGPTGLWATCDGPDQPLR